MTFELRRGGRDVERLEPWVLRDGYQLCATCGSVMVNGDRTVRQHGTDGFKYWHVSRGTCKSEIAK